MYLSLELQHQLPVLLLEQLQLHQSLKRRPQWVRQKAADLLQPVMTML